MNHISLRKLFFFLIFQAIGAAFLFIPLPKQAFASTVMEDNFDDNFLDPAWTKDLSPQASTSATETNGEIQIHAKENTFAHIERINTEDNITARARIKISDTNAGASWAPGLTLYWSAGNWTRINLSGGGVNKFSIANMINGTATSSNNAAISFGTYYWVAIELTPTLIRIYKSDDGTSWTLLTSSSRPSQFSGAPPLIILGNGYGTGASPYINPDLNNDYSSPGPFSNSYIDDFKVTKGESLMPLRNFPYPYKAGLTITSDIDASSRNEFLKIHQFLNTKETTSDMGVGVGLDIGDSFWMYTRFDVNPNPYGEFSYFINNTTTKSNDADLIRTYTHAGYLDVLHSFGRFDTVGGFTRQMGLDALTEMQKAQMAPKVYVNHGDTNNHENIGYAWYSYQRGDLPGSAEYHTDQSLYPNGPFRFLWKSDETNTVGYNPLSTVTLADGKKIYAFTRYYGPGWHVENLKDQISSANLDTLVSSGKYMVVVNHLAFTTGDIDTDPPMDTDPPFNASNTAALRNLAQRYENGDIYVTATYKLLWYNFIHDNLNWSVTGNCASGNTFNITNVTDTAFGNFVPTIEDLQGITFYTDCPANTSVILNGTNVTNQMQTNPADYQGHQSISFPLVKLLPLPEWTSDGYTHKTENYNITDYNYTFNVTNINTSPFSPALKFIGLHPFTIKEAKIGSVYYIYIPDNSTVHLSRLQPNETLSNLEVVNGTYNSSIPRLINNSNSNISIVNAAYNSDSGKTSLTLAGTGSATLTTQQLNEPFNGMSTAIDSAGNQTATASITSETNVDTVKMNIVPSTSSVNINIDTWNTSGTYYKKWTETSSSHDVTTNHTVGDLKANTYYTVNVDSAKFGTYLSNGSGQIIFTYNGGYSTKTFEVQEDGSF